MFRDKEILHQVLNVKAAIHDINLAVKDIHCKVSQISHHKYDQERTPICQACDEPLGMILEEIRELKLQMKEIIGDDETADLSSQMRYLSDSLKSIQGEISGAENLSRQLHNRAEDNANMYKKAETMINELKGVVSMARASLADKKEMQAMVNEMKGIAKAIETSYQYRASVTKRLAKLDDIHQWMQEDPEE
jgi:hypothetical protein